MTSQETSSQPPATSIIHLLRAKELGNKRDEQRARSRIAGDALRTAQEMDIVADALPGRGRFVAMKFYGGPSTSSGSGGKLLAVGTNNGKVGLTGEEQRVPMWISEPGRKLKTVVDLEWSDDVRLLFSSHANSVAKLWDLENGIAIEEYPLAERAGASSAARIAWNPERGILGATRDRGVKIIDIRTAHAEQSLAGDIKVTAIQWALTAPRVLYAAGTNGNVRIYDTRILKEPMHRRVFEGSFLEDLHLSRDGHTLFVRAKQWVRSIDAFSLVGHRAKFDTIESSIEIGNCDDGGRSVRVMDAELFRVRSSLCEAGDAVVVAVPYVFGVHYIDFSRVSSGAQPCHLRQLRGHGGLVTATAFDSVSQELHTASQDIFRWRPPMNEEARAAAVRKERPMRREHGSEDEWSD